MRQFDEQIGFTRQIAEALDDRRNANLTAHSLVSMIRQRIYGILADYQDQNVHESLRRDPVFKMIAGRWPDDLKHLAGQSTMSRFENSINAKSLFRFRDVLFDQFIASFQARPAQITIDIDAFDDPTHGQQQLTFFMAITSSFNTSRSSPPARKTIRSCWWACGMAPVPPVSEPTTT